MTTRDDFYKYQQRVMSLYREEKYRDALDLALREKDRFPARRGRSSIWIASLFCLLGETQKPIETLRESLSLGYWTSKQSLLQDPAFEPLQGRKDFEEILEECERLRVDALSRARPDFKTFTPQSYSSGDLYPLIMALAFNLADDTHYWKHALSANVIVAVVQSSQPYSADSYSWNDLERSQKDVRDLLTELKSRFPIDNERVILAGFSQGAALAIYLALARLFSCHGFIGICPAPTVTPSHAQEYAAFLRASNAQGLKGWIISGEKDRFLPKIRPYHDNLVQNGSDCKFIVDPNLGHEYPPNLEDTLVEAIHHVLA